VKQVDAELAAGTLDPFGEDVEEQVGIVALKE
jgi:hypothetical protein